MATKKKKANKKKVTKTPTAKQLAARQKRKETMQMIAKNRRQGESMADAVKRYYA